MDYSIQGCPGHWEQWLIIVSAEGFLEVQGHSAWLSQERVSLAPSRKPSRERPPDRSTTLWARLCYPAVEARIPGSSG